MNEESANTPDGERADEESGGPLAGQRLADARRAKDISISEIAKELHLDEPKVQALEENQFSILGAPVFAKGHLRKYAELVGVPIDDVLADYYKLNRAAGAPPVVGPVKKKAREISLGPWILGLVIVIVVGGILFWWFTRDTGEIVKTPGALEPFAEDEQMLVSEDEQQTTTEPAPEVVEVEEQPLPEQPAPVETEAASEPQESTPVEGEADLVMTFSGDCWTEVTDANGNRLFFGLGQAGNTVRRSGVPPMRALFGDRNNVSVTINGQEVALTGDGSRGNTARLTINAP